MTKNPWGLLVPAAFAAFFTTFLMVPHDAWFQTVYYSDAEGSEARIIINRGEHPSSHWETIELIDFPEAEWDWEYSGFDRYTHRAVSAIGWDIFWQTAPEGTTHFRLNIPSCCVQPMLAEYVPVTTLSYSDDNGWRLRWDAWRDWRK